MNFRKMLITAAATVAAICCACAGMSFAPYRDRAVSDAIAEESGTVDLTGVNEKFHELLNVNPHTVGWLKVNEYIDYPVVKYDNDHYLHTDFYGEEDDDGTLFVNEYNSLEPRDDVILIHGHNMKSGEMFGRLKGYEKFENVCAEPLINFRTLKDDEDVLYVPVYAFHASMNPDDPEYFNIMQLNFETDADYQAYLDEMAELSIWQSPADVNTDDKLLMLVTCSYYQDNGRFMLVCRQLRADEKPEDMQKLYAEAAK